MPDLPALRTTAAHAHAESVQASALSNATDRPDDHLAAFAARRRWQAAQKALDAASVNPFAGHGADAVCDLDGGERGPYRHYQQETHVDAR